MITTFSFLLVVCSLGSLSFADGLDKMRARVGKIVELKEKGVIGEQTNGLLAIIKSLSKEDKTNVEEENTDRESVYQERAKKQGVPLETLKHVLASKRIDQEPSGRMVPDKDGQWVKKK